MTSRSRSLIALTILGLTYLATQPPVLGWINRVEPDWLGVPFLVWWLTGAYVTFLATLITWLLRRR